MAARRATQMEQLFLEQVKPASDAEAPWLKHVFSFVKLQVCPLLSGPSPSADDDSLTGVCVSLSVCVVKTLRDTSVTHTLPVSYRLVSISELVSRQHLACVSCLSWNTNQQRVWAGEAELSLPGNKALPRVNLLLIGCLKEGRGGEWSLVDNSGSVRCEFLSPSPHWLDRFVFLSHWNYIPHDALGHEGVGGYVEAIGSPVLLYPGPEQGLAAGAGGGAELRGMGVKEVAGLLHSRVRGQRFSVFGQVTSVCPLLVVAGTTFFCFTLTEGKHSVPVLVKDSSRLWWSQCVCVGQSVCVSALRVCVLRGWRGNNILCVTEQSEIHTDNYTAAHTQSKSQADTPPDDGDDEEDAVADEDNCEEAEPRKDVLLSGVRLKQARIISYQGMVTEVVSEGAGLYVLDRKVGLCLAYQPTLRRKLRAGDCVELHNVHFLYRPCPDFPPSMLCTCLRSSVRVTSFSRVGGAQPHPACPGDGVLPRLLLEKNMGVSEYLWTCHLSSRLSCSLVPSMLQNQCVCVLSWKLMEFVWRRGRGRRDIYSEMLDEPHTCPLSQYTVHHAVHQYVSVSELVHSLESHCWSSVSLSSLLPSGGSSLTRSEINMRLAWSCKTETSDLEDGCETGSTHRQRPLMLVGVLELPSQTSEHKHTLQLRDGTAAVTCVVTETTGEEEAGQRAAFNTAWIGCLVCVHQFTMVTERFLHSDFPSYQHLDQDQFITDKHCRVYLQFSLNRLHILSPSVAMETHLRQRRAESGDDVTVRKQLAKERKRQRSEEEPEVSASSVAMTTGPGGGVCRACVSMVFRVEQKEGVAWRNVGVGVDEQGEGLMLYFTARAAVIGPVVSWGWDPKNSPMMERESGSATEQKVVLVFSGVSTRWFPLLHSGCFYRLIAINTQDTSILIGCGVTGRSGVELHADTTLQVQADWRFHTLTRPLLLHTCREVVSPTVLSVSEVFDCSSELVCFQGLLSDRISLNNRTADSGHTNKASGVRLTICDQSGRSLQVYMDLSNTPYPPGLLPGNTLLLSALQRKLSRSGGVYCRYLPVSSVTVVSLGDKRLAQAPPAPTMHLGLWTLNKEQRFTEAQVKGHAVCFLFLQLQWSCSLCGSLYTQSCCSSQCRSTSSVFESKAKLVIDDGTGEAHVWFSGALVRPLLGLADSQWEGLQRALRVRGHIRVYPRGRSLVCDTDADDSLFNFLVCLCSSDVVCRPLSLTCRKNNNQRTEEPKRFTRGDRDFMTRMTPPLQLTCLHLSTDAG
ncbi:CST complex subunit CTC1 [Solea senegalensis]|uniref:CST complex subunit CTC1 n=1 Tax=Solea senegalensis TaxID=28829 RepID=A0AAV6QQS0_SOLSE|nr:CST complex subunit CTC1 isoform X1 [Solea senegalensis]KAG7495806.1 CST complex subunit CTC1 [Solea senegalensis]